MLNANIIIAVLLVAIVLSVAVTTYTHVRERQRIERAKRVARLREQIRILDDIRESITTLPVEPRLKQLLTQQRMALCSTLQQFGEAPPAAPPLPVAGAITALASQQSLGRALSELQATRKCLLDMERAGGLSRGERLQLTDSLARTGVVVQVESMAAWAELPGTDRATAEVYLRDAQQLLTESLHLDSEFVIRCEHLRLRQQAIASGDRDEVSRLASSHR